MLHWVLQDLKDKQKIWMLYKTSLKILNFRRHQILKASNSVTSIYFDTPKILIQTAISVCLINFLVVEFF